MFSEAHNLASFWRAEGDWAQAEKYYLESLKEAPSVAEIHVNLGTLFLYSGRLKDAEIFLKNAIRLKPELVQAYSYLGMTLLAEGKWNEGWKLYEKRLDHPGIKLTNRFYQPEAMKEKLSGASILLVHEQGFGDSIQFIRFARNLKERGAARVIFLGPQPLCRALQGVEGVDEIVHDEKNLIGRNIDYMMPLMSMPYALQLTESDFKMLRPYLKAEPCLTESSKIRVGFCLSGNPAYPLEHFRLMQEESVASFAAEFPHLEFWNLSRDLSPTFMNVPGMDKLTSDSLALLAQAVASMDLVVSVDTVVTHLAGALGKPAILLLSKASDWRWQFGRSDSPWYPQLKILRQENLLDWTPVVAKLREELQGLKRVEN